VKRAIGSDLVDENEALFNEATALADILGDVQLSATALLARQQLTTTKERSLVCGVAVCDQGCVQVRL
jgi:hypothetical protein